MKEEEYLKPLPGVNPLFVVGCGRSGTSMILNILNRYSSIAIPSESHFLIAYMKKYDNYETLEDDLVLERLLRDILNEPFVKEFDAKFNIESLVKCVRPRTYAGVVRAIYKTFQLQHGKSRWGDKTPWYVLNINDILRLFPDAQFVHIIRDGRDCALSLIERPWGPRNVYKAANAWKSAVIAGLEQGRKLPEGKYIEIRYEKVLVNPEEELEKLFSFIGEPLSQSILREFSFKKNNYYKWKTKMSTINKQLFERVAGELLESLGYEKIFDSIKPLSAVEKVYYNIENRIKSSANIIFDVKRAIKLRFKTSSNIE